MWKDGPVDMMAKLVWTSRMAAYIMSFYGVVMSFVIIIGGPDRFSAIGYSTAMQIPGAPPVWGWTLLFSSILAITGIRTAVWPITTAGMALCGVWSMFFAISFGISAIEHNDANFTAMVAYGKDAVLFLLIAVIYRDRHKGDRRG